MFSLASLNVHMLCLCWNILSLPSLHLANSYSSLISHFRCSFLQKAFCDSNVWMRYIFYIILWHPILYSCLFLSTIPFNCFCCLYVSLLEGQDFVLFTPVSSRRTKAGNIPSQPLHLLDDDSQSPLSGASFPELKTASWTCSLSVQLGSQHYHIPNYPPLYSDQLIFFIFFFTISLCPPFLELKNWNSSWIPRPPSHQIMPITKPTCTRSPFFLFQLTSSYLGFHHSNNLTLPLINLIIYFSRNFHWLPIACRVKEKGKGAHLTECLLHAVWRLLYIVTFFFLTLSHLNTE